MDISTNIAGVILENPIYNASGCLCVTKEELDELMKSNSGAVISKSSTVNCRSGNLMPRFNWDNYGSINSMGVPNFGFNYYLDYGMETYHKKYIQSIIPLSDKDLILMLSTIKNRIENSNKNYYIIEINLSCPNLDNKSIIAYDFKAFEKYLKIINKYKSFKLILGLKLPPYYLQDDFDKISDIIKKYNCIKFITCINSVINGLLIDWKNETTLIHPKDGLGGIGGIYCKPTALANVYNFYKRLGTNNEISIIGCGGITNGIDAFEMILCGASAVQIGTQLIKKGVECFKDINDELISIMKKKKYNKISDFKGKIKLAEHL